MKKKLLIIISIVATVLIIAGLITGYIDSARVRNSVEPKYTLKLISPDGKKITYLGLGYKVIRYINVSPNEPYKNNKGVKYGSWFMNYKLSNYKSISIELLQKGKIVEVNNREDIDFITSLLKNSKYINEPCYGINTHKIKFDNEIYYLKESCAEIKQDGKQAKISTEDLNKILKIIKSYNEISINNEEQYQFTATIISVTDNSIIVKPDAGTNEIKSSDKISIGITRPTNGINDFYIVGNRIKITYNGNINESYPAQISATKIELITNN